MHLARKGIWVAALAVAVWAATGAQAQPLPASGPCSTDAAEAVLGSVQAVDARSIRLEDGRTLRLVGIEPFSLLTGNAADAEARLEFRLGELTSTGQVRFRPITGSPDRYGRLPALVWAGAALIQETLAGEGLVIAFANGASLPCFDRLLAAENSARRARRGYWENERVPWANSTALAPRVGRFAIFEGRIISVGNRPNRSFLDFGYRWSEDVTVEMSAADREAFGGEAALSALVGRRVRVRGFVEERNGPMLTVRSPAELQVLDAAKQTFAQEP
jgi:endonuclease YncB( thermonuclease family)